MKMTNQLIAFGISSYFGMAATVDFAAVNTTLDRLLSPTPFRSASARCINILFFASIVLSLAASLLGILGTPRESVLVRRISAEAWESWNFDLTMSVMPVLLEIAMLLFLIGIAILLWTLDFFVAQAITIAIAAFLVAIAALTILPVFFKCCPYKSPSACGLVVLFGITAYSVVCCSDFARRQCKSLVRWRQMYRKRVGSR